MFEAIARDDARQWRRAIAIGFSYVAAFALGMLATAAMLWALGLSRPMPPAAAATGVPIAAVPAVAQPTELPAASVTDTLSGAREAMRLGRADAPVQVVVFADPQCPYCRQSALETERRIGEEYVVTGQAALVYRHFAFLGPESRRISIALECAAEQGGPRFWAFHEQAFAHQFPENAGQATDAALTAWADASGLERARFTACLADPAVSERIDRDIAAGRALGVLGTPTLFINGRPMPGAVPFDVVQAEIERQLTAAARQ